MRVKHSIPADETDDHEHSQHCRCEPAQHVVATPLARPTVTLTHHRLTAQETP